MKGNDSDQAGGAASPDMPDLDQMDMMELMMYAQNFHIPLTGLQQADQWKERIKVHLLAEQGHHYDIQREFGVCTRDSLEKVLESLDSLFRDVRKALRDLDHSLESVLLNANGYETNTSLAKQIDARIRELSSMQCSVIVAGETNAGKSTFLNLFLGYDVLPVDIFSCTAAICQVRYGPSFSVKLTMKDGSCSTREFAGVQETKEYLGNIVGEKDEEKRLKGLDIESLTLTLPALVLKSGVTLVDTPGIGENDAMTRCTMNYVKEHSAAAYIYVVKTDNAGGVHDDRLLEFLRNILEHAQGGSDSDVFDPSSAMFVCNRWDQVRPEERQTVRNNAISKLKDVWPRFQPSQAYFLSAYNALMHYECDQRYVTEDYRAVLTGIKSVFGKAQHNAVKQHYRWLKRLVHQSTSFLQTTVHQCNMSDEELLTRFRSTKDRLDALQTRTVQATCKLRERVGQEMRHLCHTMAAILKEKEVEVALNDWSHQPIPTNPSFGGGTDKTQQWEEDVDMLIMRRLHDIVDNHIAQRGLSRMLQDTLRDIIQRELKLVDDEINSILVDLSDRHSLGSSVSSNNSCVSVDSDDTAQEMLRVFKERKNPQKARRLHGISHVTGSVSGGSSSNAEVKMDDVRKVMLKKILMPITELVRFLNRQRRRSTFSTDPHQYMKSRTQKIIKVVTENQQLLMQMAGKYREKLDVFIHDVENSVPRFVASNKQLMEDIRSNRKTYLSRRYQMVQIMKELEPVRGMLSGFGSLFIKDVTADNICFILDLEQQHQSVSVSVQRQARQGQSISDSGIGSIRPSVAPNKVSQGLWHQYRYGHVQIGDAKEQIIGRVYHKELEGEVLIKEIAHLRCLRCPNLAAFLGMSRTEECAIFLFLGDLISARKYLTKCFDNPRESVPRILEGVCHGLKYLHLQGLVHMELSLDTIMVNREAEPHLCGACLPRHARFPPDADDVKCDPFVCLSPEVLRGDLYTANDDCYSLGLVVWEMYLPEKPYHEQRASLSLAQFRDKVHPKMLGLDNNPPPSPVLADILRGFLLLGPGLRNGPDYLLNKMDVLRSDPYVVQNLSTKSRRTHFKAFKRGSSDEKEQPAPLAAIHPCRRQSMPVLIKSGLALALREENEN